MVEGAPHTAKRSIINCCVYGVPPAPVYKGARGGLGGGRAKGGSRTPHGAFQGWPTPSPSSTPLYTGREAPPRDTTIVPWIS